MTLKRWTVGLLAVGTLSACGVGVEGDDPEGQAAAGQNGQNGQPGVQIRTSSQTLTTTPGTPTAGTVPTGPTVLILTDPLLPQDPVPLNPMNPPIVLTIQTNNTKK